MIPLQSTGNPNTMTSASDLEAGVPQRPLELRDSRCFLAQHLGNDVTKQKRCRHDGLYSQILEDRRADGEEPTADDEFYGSYDVEQIATHGFPSIAAFHATYANTRICRSFDYLVQRLILVYQVKLTCLLGALADLDVEDATKSETPDKKGIQPVPFDKEKFISRCLKSPDQLSLVTIPTGDEGCEEDEQKRDRIEAKRENLIANIERILDKYFHLVRWQSELHKSPRASAKTHGKIFKKIKSISRLDPDALDYLRADDDFIYADPDPLYERFYSFLIDIKAASVISVRFLSCNRLCKGDNTPFGSGIWSAQRVRLFVKSLMVISSSALVLIPVGILYIIVPRREIALLIITLAAIVFAFTLIAFDNGMRHVLFGLAAYLALLVVLLPTLQ
ncbi:hypothetical protein F5Y12DRAFT_719573 [Xylaria sp. FL1777]|nr:hypothetical protein F5Y12DRAFT_719573 [Xylaria sp. FL1777]